MRCVDRVRCCFAARHWCSSRRCYHTPGSSSRQRRLWRQWLRGTLAPRHHAGTNDLLSKALGATGRKAAFAPRHYRIPPTRRHAAEGAFGRFRPPAGSDGALRLSPTAQRIPPRRGSSSRWRGSPPCRAGWGSPPAGRSGRSRRPSAAPASRCRDRPPAPPHAAVGRRLVEIDGREVARRRDDDIAASARPAEPRCVDAMPTNQLRTSFVPMPSTRRAPRSPPAGLRHRNRSRRAPGVHPAPAGGEVGRKRGGGWRPGGRRRRRSPPTVRRRQQDEYSNRGSRQHGGHLPGPFLRHRPRRRALRGRALQGPRRRRHPPLARRDADEGQGPAHGEARLRCRPVA